jgi:type IV pilus assembly protein PilM
MKLRTLSSRCPIGLDVGGHSIKAVQLRPGPGRKTLHAALSLGRTNPGEPFTAEEAGRLVDVLGRRGFAGRQVVLVIPANTALTGVLTLPPRSSGAPLAQIAASELARAHRREPHELEVAFWELPQPARAAEGTHVMAAGCSHEDADRWLNALECVGLDVVALDTQGWAIARASAAMTPQSSGMVAAVDIGWDSATLVLLHQTTVVYERNLNGCGVKPLIQAIGHDQQLAPEVVDYLLYDLGLDAETRGKEGDRKLSMKVRGYVQSLFDQLEQELQLAMGYAQHQYPQAPVQQVLLVGGGAAIAGLSSQLAQSLETAVEVVSPKRLFDCPAPLAEQASHPALTVAAGLAMVDMVQEAAA